jgi:hypothetical protein
MVMAGVLTAAMAKASESNLANSSPTPSERLLWTSSIG